MNLKRKNWFEATKNFEGNFNFQTTVSELLWKSSTFENHIYNQQVLESEFFVAPVLLNKLTPRKLSIKTGEIMFAYSKN